MVDDKKINWQQLHRDAGYKKYLRKLTVASAAAGLEDPNNWQIKIDFRAGTAIIYHVPTLQAAQEAAKKEAGASPAPELNQAADVAKDPGADGAAA